MKKLFSIVIISALMLFTGVAAVVLATSTYAQGGGAGGATGGLGGGGAGGGAGGAAGAAGGGAGGGGGGGAGGAAGAAGGGAGSGGAACDLPDTRYGIPTWYKYLEGETDPADGTTCRLMVDFSTDATNSLISIGLAVTEIMLFVAGIVASIFIVYGGFRYVLSQGNPDQTKVAKDAVLNAVIGLVITILAAVIVRFVAAELST